VVVLVLAPGWGLGVEGESVMGEALFWLGGAGLLAVSSLWMAFKREAARQDLIVSVVLGDTETTP
jgi:hypothetical protein